MLKKYHKRFTIDAINRACKMREVCKNARGCCKGHENAKFKSINDTKMYNSIFKLVELKQSFAIYKTKKLLPIRNL